MNVNSLFEGAIHELRPTHPTPTHPPPRPFIKVEASAHNVFLKTTKGPRKQNESFMYRSFTSQDCCRYEASACEAVVLPPRIGRNEVDVAILARPQGKKNIDSKNLKSFGNKCRYFFMNDYLKMSRWLSLMLYFFSLRCCFRDSARTTERCFPPVQPRAMVRVLFPSSTKWGIKYPINR